MLFLKEQVKVSLELFFPLKMSFVFVKCLVCVLFCSPGRMLRRQAIESDGDDIVESFLGKANSATTTTIFAN